MPYIKITKNNGRVIAFLRKKNIVDNRRKILSDDTFIYIPIKELKENSTDNKKQDIKKKIYDVIQREFKESNNIVNFEIVNDQFINEKIINKKDKIKGKPLKELLKNYFNEEEINKIKTSYDVVGDIAIIEIDPEFINKKEIIGKAIMEINPHVKTVLMKKGKHEGVFRIQDYDFVVGEDKRETIHKENNVALKLKVDETYFSVRLSHERKRIYEQIKEGEKVLVMFSGVGPYAIEIAKNTKAYFVYGIELNPKAHYYSYENKFLNKTLNFLPILGDVKEVSKKLLSYSIGLKSSLNKKELLRKLNNKVNKNVNVLELFLLHEDIVINNGEIRKNMGGINKLLETIDFLKERGINVIVHIPLPFKWKDIDNYLFELKILGDIAKEKKVLVVVHLPPTEEIKNNPKIQNILERYKDFFYYENLIEKGFTREYNDFLKIKDLVKNVCIDISHYGIYLKDEKKIIEEIKRLSKEFNIYFHVNSYIKNIDSYDLEDGELNIDKFIPYLTFGVIEVRNKNELDPKEMIKSYEWISKKDFRFDRILMPLPKGGEDFLDDALNLIKDNGIIHFYDFLHEDHFDEAVNKISQGVKKKGLNFEVLNLVKCGQYAPRTFRICVDFKVTKNKD